MKSKLFFPVCLIAALTGLLAAGVCAEETTSPRERLSLDAGWKFYLGNPWGQVVSLAKAGENRGPAKMDFSDADWRTVNLPHDWAVELPFDQRADFNHGFKPVGPGFATNDIAWYRRTFELAPADSDKRIWLEFDGVFRNCDVFVNGWFVGHHDSGYEGFRYDVTDVINGSGKNVVAVKVDVSQFEGWRKRVRWPLRRMEFSSTANSKTIFPKVPRRSKWRPVC